MYTMLMREWCLESRMLTCIQSLVHQNLVHIKTVTSFPDSSSSRARERVYRRHKPYGNQIDECHLGSEIWAFMVRNLGPLGYIKRNIEFREFFPHVCWASFWRGGEEYIYIF